MTQTLTPDRGFMASLARSLFALCLFTTPSDAADRYLRPSQLGYAACGFTAWQSRRGRRTRSR